MIAAEGYLHFHHFPDEAPARDLATAALPIVEQAAAAYLLRFDHPRRGEVVVEEGSTKVRGIIRVTAAALIGYGALRQALDYARSDGKAAAGWIVEQVQSALNVPPDANIARRRRTPAPTRFRRLFDSVEAGTLSAADAEERAEAILEEYRETPDTIAQVTAVFRQELRQIAPAEIPPRIRREPTHQLERAVTFLPGRRLRVFRHPSTGQLQYVEE